MPRVAPAKGYHAFLALVCCGAFVELAPLVALAEALFAAPDTGLTEFAVLGALSALPYLLLPSLAGHLVDRLPRDALLRRCAAAGALLALVEAGVIHLGLPPVAACALVPLAGILGAIARGARAAYLRDLAGQAALTAACASAHAGTALALLAALLLLPPAFDGVSGGAPALATILAAGLGGLIAAWQLPAVPPAAAGLEFDRRAWLHARYLRANLARIAQAGAVRDAVVGLALYWALAHTVLALLPWFFRDVAGLDQRSAMQALPALAALGAFIGARITAVNSRRHLELGFIPIGALGITLGLVLLPKFTGAGALALEMLLLGSASSFFVVPLQTLLVLQADDACRGRVLAAGQFARHALIVAFLAGTTAAAARGGFGTRPLLGALAAIAAAGTLYTLYRLPQSLVRLMIAQVFGTRFKLRVFGFENLPRDGGVLLLGNHISWIDWAMVQMASPRPVRFVMKRSIYERWYLQRFLDFFGCVPIAAGDYNAALATISRLLNAGELVCLFPEGAISRTGHLGEFKRGYEKAAAGAHAVIVPFYLRGLWGSSFSRSSLGLKQLRQSGRRREVIVAFGPPLPATTPAPLLKQRIFELSITAWEGYTALLPALPRAWLQAAKHTPSEAAVADSDGTEFTRRRFVIAAILIRGLLRRRIEGRNVGILLPTSSGGALSNMALLMLGRTVVNLNYTAPREAIVAAIEQAEIRTIVTARRFLTRLDDRGIDLAPVLAGRQVVMLDEIRREIRGTSKLLAAAAVTLLPTRALCSLYCRRTDIDAPAAILFSSGSEGVPKGVVLSHRNIMANVKQISDVLNTEVTDVVMATLPLFHAFGLTVTTFMPLVEGIPMVTHPDPTDALGVAKAVARFRGTILCGTSTFLRLYTKNPRVLPLMFEPLRIVVAGAEKLSPQVREAFKLKFNKEVLEGYGVTETTPVASCNIPDELEFGSWRVQTGTKHGTVGMPLPGTSFRIVDPVTLAELPTGKDGLILIGGSQIMLGYLNDPQRTDAAIVMQDGKRWYKTGDKGHLDEDGFLTIVDRYSRFAKIGGEMVSLTAVEERVRHALGAAELDLVAVALPDRRKGEQIALLVADPNLDPDWLRRQLTGSGVNGLMLPNQIVTVKDVPKLGSGKTDFGAAKRLAEALADVT
ncbi:MAG: MFS transporter [Gammaproteobacteria bacterium]|nr:MFS transporter [Gammaproteobacteria bacterium]